MRFRKSYKSSSDQNFVVSMFHDVSEALNSCPIISASLVSKDCLSSFEYYNYGFLYYPKADQIIGMAPFYLDYASQDNLNSLYATYRKDPFFDLFACQRMDTGVDFSAWVISDFRDFRRIYSIPELKKKAQKYIEIAQKHIEIALRSDTKPVAIFVKQEILDSVFQDVQALCRITRLPLVVWGEHETEVITDIDIDNFSPI